MDAPEPMAARGVLTRVANGEGTCRIAGEDAIEVVYREVEAATGR